MVFAVLSCSELRGQDFFAYHTKLVHTSTDYFGKYADLIVVLGEGSQLEFTRRTQYLPKWVTPRGSFMVDDFYPGRDLDHEFNYNYVRLIENTPERIVVHWRYIPDISRINQANLSLDPTFIQGFTSAVHETFTIYPSGRIERAVKDARGSRYENWIRDDFADKQLLILTEDGVQHGSVTWGNKLDAPVNFVDKNPVIIPQSGLDPVLQWSFDEGGGNYPEELQEEVEEMMEWEPEALVGSTVEATSGEFNTVTGHTSIYKKGISGTALAFDGYYSGVQLDEESIPEFSYELSIEGWIALDVYPYNKAPIIHHSESFGEKGFYLGVDAYGKLVLTVDGQSVLSNKVLELYRWTHVSGVIGNGKVELFVDGVKVASEDFDGVISRATTDLMIGLNNKKERCTDYVRSPLQNIEFIYGIQGLLDEIKVYDKALSEPEIGKSYKAFLPKDRKSPLKKAVLPGEVGVAPQFGAVYKNLEHHELWDKMWRLADQTDVVVKFDNNPASVVYWHGTNFAANWVTDNNRWMADQSSEIFTKHGCSEHMADKQTRHSYARIVENHEARVVVHWRYPCVDVGYICTDRRNWTDEYHTIYPDGTAVRKVVFNNVRPPGFQDIQFFTNPGETALDVVNINAMTVANRQGETLELVWEKPNNNPEQYLDDATIEWLNSKSKWKVFTVFQGPGISTWGRDEQSKFTDDPFAGPWNHWPVSLVPSDGRYAVAHDRVTHFAIGANDNAPIHGAMVHYGFTSEQIEGIIPIARYWQTPPEITSLNGAISIGFSKEEKAYLFEYNGSNGISFIINASEDSPVINPAFVISNASIDQIELGVNGKTVHEGKDLRIGKTFNGDGKEKTVVWVRTESEKPIRINLIF